MRVTREQAAAHRENSPRFCREATDVPSAALMESSSEPAFKSQRLVSVCVPDTHIDYPVRTGRASPSEGAAKPRSFAALTARKPQGPAKAGGTQPLRALHDLRSSQFPLVFGRCFAVGSGVLFGRVSEISPENSARKDSHHAP